MQGYPDPVTVTLHDDSSGSGNDTDEVVTIVAAATDRWVIDDIHWSYDDASTTGKVTISIDGTDEFDLDIIRAAGDDGSIHFENGFYASDVNEEVIVTLEGAGGTTDGKLNVNYR